MDEGAELGEGDGAGFKHRNLPPFAVPSFRHSSVESRQQKPVLPPPSGPQSPNEIPQPEGAVDGT